MRRNQAIGFALLALVGAFGMNLLADRMSADTKTDQVTGEMLTNDGGRVVRTGTVESFAGLLALLRASPEQLSKLTYAFFSTTWLDGRVSWDSWKVASYSRFGPAELLLRFATCGYDLLITDTALALRKDGEKVGTVEVGADEIALHERELEQATNALKGDGGITLQSHSAFWTEHREYTGQLQESHSSFWTDKRRQLQEQKNHSFERLRALGGRRGAGLTAGGSFAMEAGSNRAGND